MKILTTISKYSKFPRGISTSINPNMAKICIPSENQEILKSPIEDIFKSPIDNRSYRGVILNNGLKALLISDSSTDKSAASVTVGAGSMHDPEHLMGLAHYLEHMLFLGSKKYPRENDYQKYVEEHAGYTNAYTTSVYTNYFFDVHIDSFGEALDRFAQFFIEPLFNASALDREVNAVNSEHEKNIADDRWRLRQIEKITSQPGHPYGKFSTGNKATLGTIPKSKGIVIRDEVMKFYQERYSSNVMTAAVLGKESLDDLEAMVRSIFSPIQNKNLAPETFSNHPYGPEQVSKKIYVASIKDIRSMKITFPIPDISHLYKSAPDRILSHLLGHEGGGSLHSILKKKSLCNNLAAGLDRGAPGFSFFHVTVDLTEYGIECPDEILTLLFQYICMLHDKVVDEELFEELKKLSDMSFRFKDKETPEAYVMRLSNHLHIYPFEDVLCGPYIQCEWKPDTVLDLLKKLNPENVRVMLCGKKFEEKANNVEPWYGVKYSVESIPGDLIQKWKTVELCNEMHMPLKNEFIASNFDLFPSESGSRHPELIRDSNLSRIWFKQDDVYLLPKLIVKIEILSPFVSISPQCSNLTYIFTALLPDALNEYSYAALLAHLNWEIGHKQNGLNIEFQGINENLPVLIQKVMENLTNFKIDAARFEILKENYIRGLKNFNTKQPYEHGGFYNNLLLCERGWSKEELLEVACAMDVKMLEKFICEMFSSIYIQCLIHGNCDQKTALNIAALIEGQFSSSRGLLAKQLLLSREVVLPEGSFYAYEVKNEYHSSSCLYNYYQCMEESTKNDAVLDLIAQILHEPCYSYLRTEKQLGYIVHSGARRGSGMTGLVIVVQSEQHPIALDVQVEIFLRSFMDETLALISDEDFSVHKEALCAKKLVKPKRLAGLTAKYWHEIAARYYNFDRAEKEVAFLRTLDKKDVISFYETLIYPSSSKRKILAVRIISKNAVETSEEVASEPIKIKDMVAFKNSMNLSRYPEPCMDIAPLGTKSKL